MIENLISKRDKNTYIRIASELLYGEEVIHKIKSARTQIEIENIMKGAREKWKQS